MQEQQIKFTHRLAVGIIGNDVRRIICYYLLIYYRILGAFKTRTYRIGRELVEKKVSPPIEQQNAR